MKKTIRQEILKKRNQLTKDQIKEKSQLICHKFLASKEYQEAQRIFVFLSFGSEVQTDQIVQAALDGGKEVYVPWIDKDAHQMEAIQIKNLDDLAPGPLGIRQPSTGGRNILSDIRGRNIPSDRQNVDSVETVNNYPAQLLVCVPGLAFDRQGFRVGYGKGYYDRFFARLEKAGVLNPIKMALGFQLQIIDRVPAQDHDVAVDFIFTENEIIEI